jgi:hypothetical protein
MGERVCRYCQRSFRPSKFQPAQIACSDPACQRRRRNDYHRRKAASDPVYRQVCQVSAQKWRAEHPGYWIQLREQNPSRAERNRQCQCQRDQRRRQSCKPLNLRHRLLLANNSPLVKPSLAAR